MTNNSSLSSQEAQQDLTVSSVVNNFAVALREHDNQDRGFFLLVGFLELLRVSSPAQIAAAAKFLDALVAKNFVAGWDKISFSLTQQLLTSQYDQLCLNAGIPQEDVPFVLSVALSLLSDCALGSNNERARAVTKDDMTDRVKTVLSLFDGGDKETLPDAPPPLPPVVPLVDATRYLPSGFSPSPLSYAMLAELDAEYITHRGVLSSGELSSDIRGLMLSGPRGLVAFLESGEFISLTPGQLGVATFSDVVALKNFPQSTLLYFILTADTLLEQKYITQTQHSLLLSGAYGEVDSNRLVLISAPVEDLSVLDECLVASSSFRPTPGIPQPNPLSMDFDFSDSQDVSRAFRITANYSESGSYITSKFGLKDAPKDENEEAIFKPTFSQTIPRFMTAHGVYLFPLPETSVTYALLVV